MSLHRIIHTADCHGTDAVYQNLRGQIDEHTLLLDAGDSIAGSNTAFRWSEPNLRLLSELHCQAMTMGNRELHYLPWILERRAGERTFPLLAANLVDLWGRQTTWQEGVSLSFQELKVGVFGMTVVQYPVGSLYEKVFGLRFLPPETLIEYLVERYQKEHDLVIFLSHLGIEQDRKLAEQLAKRPDLKCDFILGGHTHLTMAEPEVYGSTRLSHIGSHSSGYGLWEQRNGEWCFELQAEKAVS
ncbi:MAG: metallophosphoesterase [Vulcanimicrobiota bacterium]